LYFIVFYKLNKKNWSPKNPKKVVTEQSSFWNVKSCDLFLRFSHLFYKFSEIFQKTYNFIVMPKAFKALMNEGFQGPFIHVSKIFSNWNFSAEALKNNQLNWKGSRAKIDTQ
jgi:hypothetical protein